MAQKLELTHRLEEKEYINQELNAAYKYMDRCLKQCEADNQFLIECYDCFKLMVEDLQDHAHVRPNTYLLILNRLKEYSNEPAQKKGPDQTTQEPTLS